MNVSLTPKLVKLVQRKVDSGLYNNASEVIREALRLLQESDEFRRARLKRLNAALIKGEADLASGRVSVLEDDEDLDALFARL